MINFNSWAYYWYTCKPRNTTWILVNIITRGKTLNFHFIWKDMIVRHIYWHKKVFFFFFKMLATKIIQNCKSCITWSVLVNDIWSSYIKSLEVSWKMTLHTEGNMARITLSYIRETTNANSNWVSLWEWVYWKALIVNNIMNWDSKKAQITKKTCNKSSCERSAI